MTVVMTVLLFVVFLGHGNAYFFLNIIVALLHPLPPIDFSLNGGCDHR